MGRDSPNIKEDAVAGSLPDKCLLYSVCTVVAGSLPDKCLLYSVRTAVEFCKNYRCVHEYVLFLTACIELPTTNNKQQQQQQQQQQRRLVLSSSDEQYVSRLNLVLYSNGINSA